MPFANLVSSPHLLLGEILETVQLDLSGLLGYRFTGVNNRA